MRTQLIILFLASAFSVLAQRSEADKLAWEGNNLYEEELYSEAEYAYRNAIREDPLKAESHFNLGNTSYAQGRYEEAAGHFQNYLSNPGLSKEEKAQAWYNVGNSKYNNQDLAGAVEAYKESLRLNPDDVDTKHNLMMSLREQQKQEQEQQQNQENEDQENKDQKEEQDQEGDQKDQEKQDEQEGDKGEEEQEEQEGKGEEEEKEDGEGEQPPAKPEERNMTPEELERILQALENDEKDVQKKINAQRTKAVRVDVEKDW